MAGGHWALTAGTGLHGIHWHCVLLCRPSRKAQVVQVNVQMTDVSPGLGDHIFSIGSASLVGASTIVILASGRRRTPAVREQIHAGGSGSLRQKGRRQRH